MKRALFDIYHLKLSNIYLHDSRISMNKFKAAGIHFLISCTIVIIVLLAMYFLWYPGQYFKLMGGLTLIITLACVDAFLGPTLTLVAYKPDKKSLKFDLFCIAIFQLTALAYGIYVMFQARPVFTVFNKDHFQISAVVDISAEELPKGRRPEFRNLSLTGPKLVSIYTPNKKNKYEWMFAMTESDMAYRYPRLFDDYDAHKMEVIRAGRSLQDFDDKSNAKTSALEDFLKHIKRPASDFIALPISSELEQMTAIVDAKTGEFIDIVDIQLPEKKL